MASSSLEEFANQAVDNSMGIAGGELFGATPADTALKIAFGGKSISPSWPYWIFADEHGSLAPDWRVDHVIGVGTAWPTELFPIPRHQPRLTLSTVAATQPRTYAAVAPSSRSFRRGAINVAYSAVDHGWSRRPWHRRLTKMATGYDADADAVASTRGVQ